ncbi:AcaB family transcriptional regulator [Kosakonia radicincitans]|uniref:AcaB family transcriptional regulator n=1 Tax=Kosakonia radicincitans TaxID=283686 RepID=UPI0005C2BB2F|nr:AcaB family transcriptional regulator [Kosakonia radicincitans]KIS42433.1 hypothetical protein LG58_3330 [Kosakonia radicincitans YD4]
MPGTTLLSDIHITLHTRVAVRLWQARHGGMLLCLALLKRLLRAEQRDDPWASHWLEQLSIRLNLMAHLLKQKNNQLDNHFNTLPAAIGTTLLCNPTPSEYILPLALLSPPGSRLLHHLVDYDLLVRRTLLAWQLGLISQAEKRDVVATLPRLLLQLYSFVNRFRTTGVIRADVRDNTPLAQATTRKLGQLPKRILAEIHRDAQ